MVVGGAREPVEKWRGNFSFPLQDESPCQEIGARMLPLETSQSC
jgi:hypothetical protein